MRHRRTSSPAFTLIEVLAVVVIIGIAGAIVVPQMLQAGTLHIQGASRMVIADIIFAQNDAIARQKPREILIDTANNKYSVADQTGTILAANWQSGGLYTTNFKTDTRFSGVSISATSYTAAAPLTFDELGSPSAAGTIDLVSGTLKYRVSVAAFTGQVTVAKIGG